MSSLVFTPDSRHLLLRMRTKQEAKRRQALEGRRVRATPIAEKEAIGYNSWFESSRDAVDGVRIV